MRFGKREANCKPKTGGVMRMLFLVVLILVGCAQGQWVKGGITQQEANQDHYACLQASQQRGPSPVVNVNTGVAPIVVSTNWYLYEACMGARGYTYRSVQ
jgi:hypothetical protein